jgi:hypothetical protein
MRPDEDKIKKIVLDLVRNYGVNSIEISSEPLTNDPTGKEEITHEESEECAWVEEQREGGGTSWKCQQRQGQSCSKGTCKSITVTTTTDGVRKTVSYCECSG